jgi:hypothetical protein
MRRFHQQAPASRAPRVDVAGLHHRELNVCMRGTDQNLYLRLDRIPELGSKSWVDSRVMRLSTSWRLEGVRDGVGWPE